MTDDLLHLLGTARGIETRVLFKEIAVSRDNGLWPHREPVDEQALQLVLFGLQATGQIVLVAGSGWFLTSQVPKGDRRRTFDEAEQKELFA